MNDRTEIEDLLVGYATAIDRRDWDLLRETFTTDCHLEYDPIGTWDGVEAVVDFMVAAHAGAGHTLHRISNRVIAVDGGRATSRTYGFYDDELVRTSDGWRIAVRRFTAVRFAQV
jgi:3-phenylpropionate/cinnamic acid dioxygenase small subunit